MKLMVFGVTGMLGNKVFGIADKQGMDVYGTIRGESEDKNIVSRIDITKKDSVEHVISETKPDAVVNCAGLVKPLCKDKMAIYTNSIGPRLIAESCDKHGCRMVHVSTDCVFSGKKGNYNEDDTPDATDLYGRSKLLGEIYDNPNVLTIRTSFIGKELKKEKYGLMDWFLSQKGEVKGYSNAFFTGLTNTALAKVLLELAEMKDVHGLLHVGGEKWNKYDLLVLIKDVFGLDIGINPYKDFKCDRSLDSSKLNSLGIKIPSMKEMIEELKGDYQ
jgi:dTDP-4-dehydrorhamnose reductase